MKTIALIIPGLSDIPLSALGGQTPLEAARVEGLDRLASCGRLGTAEVIPREVPDGSVVGLPALLGYDAQALSLRRGPLEAHGMGIPLSSQDLALRLNFISSFRGTMADTRAGHISDREARVLLQALRRVDSPLEMTIHVGAGYRHLVVVSGGADMEVSSVPPQDVLGQALRDFQPFGRDAEPFVRFLEDSAALLAEHDVNRVRIDLGENPADGVWLWGEGTDVPVPPLAEHLQLRASMIAAAPLVRGLARKVGMSCPDVPGATGDRETALNEKCRMALLEAETHDFVMVHVASVNEASRAGDARAKVQALVRLDRELVMPFLRWVENDREQRRLLVTSDHQTSVEASVDAVEPVPFAVYGGRMEGLRERPFHEAAARAAGLDLPDARSLLQFVLDGASLEAGGPR